MVRNLIQEEKAQQSGKQNLGIIINGNIPCRRTGISCGNGKLAAAGKKSGKHQAAKLSKAHRMKMEKQVRQRNQTGKAGKEKDDKRSFYSAGSQNPYIGIGNSCA